MAVTRKQLLGRYGEELAIKYFKSNGYKIVARNYRCPHGEIDLVCSTSGKLYFVEVKTRMTATFGHPEEAISPAKRERIFRCAQHFLTTQAKYALKDFVFHVCAISTGLSKDIIRVYTNL